MIPNVLINVNKLNLTVIYVVWSLLPSLHVYGIFFHSKNASLVLYFILSVFNINSLLSYSWQRVILRAHLMQCDIMHLIPITAILRGFRDLLIFSGWFSTSLSSGSSLCLFFCLHSMLRVRVEMGKSLISTARGRKKKRVLKPTRI